MKKEDSHKLQPKCYSITETECLEAEIRSIKKTIRELEEQLKLKEAKLRGISSWEN